MGAVYGGAEAGGEGEAKNILAVFGVHFHYFGKIAHICGGGAEVLRVKDKK